MVVSSNSCLGQPNVFSLSAFDVCCTYMYAFALGGGGACFACERVHQYHRVKFLSLSEKGQVWSCAWEGRA